MDVLKGDGKMSDREKVLAGLEKSLRVWNGKMAAGVDYDVLKAAGELLRARGLTIGEFYGEGVGYLEYITKRPGFSNFDPLPVLISNVDDTDVTLIFRRGAANKLPLDMYNKSWRVWSEYPTHKMLVEVKWND